MAISYIGSASNEAATITIPAHQAGDLIIIWAWRENVTNPTIPANWTNITNTTDGTTCSISMGWRIATTAAETSGTWTNATSTACHVYRGAADVGPNFSTATTGATQTWNALNVAGQGSWLAGFIGHRSIDTTTLTTPPTSMTNLTSTLGATSDVASHDTQAIFSGEYATNNTTSGGTNSGAITAIIEIRQIQDLPNNYQFIRVGNGMSVSEKIR